MSETPPPYAQYPRNLPSIGSSAQLQALMEAYYGYSKLFLAQLGIAILWIAAIVVSGDKAGFVYIGGIPLIMLAIGFLSFPLNKKLGFGANWSQAQIILASVMMAFTVICYGILGYIIIQTIAANHIKKFDVKGGFFGVRKKTIQAKIAELQASGN